MILISREGINFFFNDKCNKNKSLRETIIITSKKIRKDLKNICKELNNMIKDLDSWSTAPVWDPKSISIATEKWFKYLG